MPFRFPNRNSFEFTDVPEINIDNPADETARAIHGRARHRRFSLAVLATICAVLLFILALDLRARAVTNAKLAVPSVVSAFEPQESARDFSRFSHSISEHRQNCASCHRRTDNSAEPRLPGHKSCMNCHVQQFVNTALPMCSICHTNLEQGRPPIKSFPAMQSFDARFDHAQHMQGSARPENGCVSCHAPMRRGLAFSMPATLNAHTQCFQCHTPQAQSGGRDIGSCGTCHDLGRLTRASTGSRAFNVGFSHATHSARQRLDCADCHTVRAGAPPAQQIASPRPTQHFASPRAQSCMTCHNNRRAFGGDDFSDCKRCHKGQTFRM